MRNHHITDVQTAIDEIFINLEFFLEGIEEILQRARSEQNQLNDNIDLSNIHKLESYFREIAWQLSEHAGFAEQTADEAEICKEIITNDHNVIEEGEAHD